MKERIGLSRKKVTNPVIANPSLTSSDRQTKVAMSSGTAFSGHDLSRISPRYQAKLSISQPGDAYEREADTIAQKVMRMGDRSLQQQATPQKDERVQLKPVGELITPLVQREAIPEEEELQAKSDGSLTIQRESMPEDEEELLQMKADTNSSIQREAMPEEEEEESLQMKADKNLAIQREEIPEEEELVQAKSPLQRAGGLAASNDISSKLHSRRGGGSPLSDNVRGFMEPRFGADFSHVKVHTDGEAVQMARDVGAQAFAYGSDVYFGAGKSPGNNELTAHELTHVVQQTGFISTKSGSQLMSSNDSNVSIQRQVPPAVPVAALAIAAASFAVNSRDAGTDAFGNTNVQFRYSRDKPGPHKPPIETEHTIFEMDSIKGLGSSYAFLKLFLKYDGENIISAYTQQYKVSGYDGGVFGSEAAVNFSAVQSSEPGEPITEAYLLFQGFNNPSGPGFQRFAGRILVTGDGRVEPKQCNLTGGTGITSISPWCRTGWE
jgi:Domain of unknown function (DUF4157)